MKKLLTFLLTALLTFSVGWADEVQDFLNRATTGVTNGSSTYTEWSGKTATSAAVYAGCSAGGNNSIQIRTTNSNSGIVTTASGGKVKSIKITFESHTSAGRTINIYGKDDPYTAATDLYDSNNQGTFIDEIYYDGSTTINTLTINGDYQYIGIRSKSGAIYVSSIIIYWETSDAPAPTQVSTITAAEALDLNSEFEFTGNAVVTYQNGDNLWIRDASGSGLIVGNIGSNFANGDILTSGWTATNTMSNGIPQFTSPSGVSLSSNGGTVAPEALTTLSTADVNKYASISHIKITRKNGNNYYYEVNGVEYCVRNHFGSAPLTVGITYDVEGVVSIYNNEPQLYLISATELDVPYLLVSPNTLTISDSDTNNTFTVNGNHLGNDDVGVTVPQGSVFSTTTDDQSWGFENNNGSVSGTATVTYGGRKLYDTETVTAANNLTSATVDVTYVPDLYIVGNYSSGWDFSTGAATAMTNNGNGTYTATLQNIPANSYILFARATGVTYNWENDANRLFIGTDTNGGDWAFGTNTSGNLDTDPTNDNPVKYHPIYFSEAGTYVITVTVNTNNGTGTFSITKETVNEGDFVLVKDASQLTSGNEVIIVNKGVQSDVARTMGQRTDNNYRGTGVEVSSSLTVAPTADTQIFKLEQGNDGWYFKTSDNLYLTSISSSPNSGSNYLNTKSKDANGAETSLAVITIDSNYKATIHFQGSGTRKYLRYNENNLYTSDTGYDLFSCYQYATSMADVYIYQRTASTEPSIDVNPSTIDIVIPAGSTSEQGTATVTENNTTGTTSVSVSGEDASHFTASLNNGTLTVTYDGTATADDPDEATVTLTNGSASATVNVTGYKLPMTVTITPGDGHTFSTSTVTGIIESNVADALIEYSFDGNTWYTYNADDGFTTPEVIDINGTVTVYARATSNGETVTAQATYTRVAPSTKCTADIVFAPTSNNGEMSQWSTLKGHIGEGSDYVYDATVSKLFTSQNYSAMRFGSGSATGQLDLTLDLSKFTGGACKLTKVTINAARYSNDTGCELTVSTDVNTTGQTLSITADQTSFADYVFNFDGSEITTLSIANVTVSKRVYVHSISLEYDCAAPVAQTATLADIESSVEQGKLVLVEDELIGTWAVDNPVTGDKLLWAKDQGNLSIDKRPGKTDTQRDYVKDILKYEWQETWDESNWVILDFGGIEGDPFEFVGHKIKAGTVNGIYVNDENYRIQLTMKPGLTNGNPYSQDAPEYPGWVEPFPEDKLGTDYDLAYNSFVPANFMTENHNSRLENGEVVGGFVAPTTALYDHAGDSLYFINPKIQEVAHIWAVWNGGDEDIFTVYLTEHKENENINAWSLNGTFKVDWTYNCKSTDYDVNTNLEYGRPENLVPNMAYEFHAAIMRPNTSKRGDVEPQGTANPGTPSPDYMAYPLDMSDAGTPTAVIELNGLKTVVSISYYNLMGIESNKPFEGINIVVTRYSDGNISTVKILR